MIRVLAVDDHDFFRGCLVEAPQESSDLQVVGECADGSEVVAAVRSLRPDVVLMDVRMTTMSGLEAAAALQRDQASCRVLLLTSDTTADTLASARAKGAAGYLSKGMAPSVIRDAIRRVARGSTAWPGELEPATA